VDYKFDMKVLLDASFKSSQRAPNGNIPIVKFSPDVAASELIHEH